jgi:putative oxidoreductase
MLNKWLTPYANWANFILRSFVGVIFCAHGCYKLLFGVGLDAAAKVFEQYGIVPGATWATVFGIVELIPGIALLAGLFTRYMALFLAVVMAGAIFAVHMQYGFFLPNGVEFAFALLAANLTLLVGGPGALALDEWLKRRGMFAVHRHEQRSIRQAA